MRCFFAILIGLLGLSFTTQAARASEHLPRKHIPSEQEVRFMQEVYKQHNSELVVHTRARLLENTYLLEQAQSHYPALLERQANVGFDNHYHIRRYLLDAWLAQGWFDPQTLGTFAPPSSQNATWLMHTLGHYPSSAQMTDAQLAVLEHIDVLPASNGFAALTFADFYSAMSMQVKFRLHQGDIAAYGAELNRWYQYRQATNKISPKLAKQQLTLSRLEYLALGDILRPTLLNQLGVQEMMHGQSPMLDTLKANITDAQIDQYYQQHKSRFTYIESVMAQGALFREKSQADTFYAEATKLGANHAFAQQQNIFADQGGVLTRQDKHRGFAQQLAFTNPAHTLSRTVRTPTGQWLVVYTADKRYATYPAGSQTVRYQAKNDLAREQAKRQYQQGFMTWLAQLENQQ
ncbi:peptidyl-prolyl cis-trans isomerase [Pseudoalteromonas sp. GB56]